MDSRKLMRCTVANRSGSLSVRFVELEQFRLWEYMMSHRHGHHVQEACLSLWVNAHDFSRHDDLYMRSGEIERVNRVVVSIFDGRNGYAHTIDRFVCEEDTGTLQAVLMSHVPEALRNSDHFELAVHQGFCIERGRTSDLSRFVLGLSHEFG